MRHTAFTQLFLGQEAHNAGTTKTGMDTVQTPQHLALLTGLPLGPSSPGGPLGPGGPAAPEGPASPFSPLSPLGPWRGRWFSSQSPLYAHLEQERCWPAMGHPHTHCCISPAAPFQHLLGPRMGMVLFLVPILHSNSMFHQAGKEPWPSRTSKA